MTPAYYNENDPAAAAWLRELIAAGLIAPGDVGERSICDVQPSDLAGYSQVHLFAGIGGWSAALRLAGWDDDRPVWTGSAPCQPFSAAGKRKGTGDARHLWPEMFRLIRECRPYTVFGEQVESAIRLGWLDGISADLEGEGYAVGAIVLGAHSVGAPHIRQRLWWMADAERGRQAEQESRAESWAQGSRVDGWMGNADGTGPQGRPAVPECSDQRLAGPAGLGFWTPFDLIPCRYGKTRRIEPGSKPLAHGIPARVGRLRGYGNAIVPQVAAEFITAYLECREAVSA